VILRFSDGKSLLLDGLLDKGGTIAEHAVVVDAHLGQGNVLLFGNNPVYRGETVGSYAWSSTPSSLPAPGPHGSPAPSEKK